MKLAYMCGVAALLSSTIALAEHPGLSSRGAGTPSRGSMARPLLQVGINTAKNPQSRGLPNALGQLADNAVKHQENGNGPNRVERPERTLPPSVTDRPTPAAFREGAMPDRPLPPGLAARDHRPLPPGFLKK
jgi:hypothetical protein